MAKTLLQMENVQDRHEIAAYLRRIAEKLDADGTVSLKAGEQSVDLQVPEQAEFEVKVEQERSFRGTKGETSIELEIEWDEQTKSSSRDLEIQ